MTSTSPVGWMRPVYIYFENISSPHRNEKEEEEEEGRVLCSACLCTTWIEAHSTVALSHQIKEEKAVSLERSPSLDKKPKRQSTHLKKTHTVSPRFAFCIKVFWTRRHCSGETNGIIMNIMWRCGSYTDDLPKGVEKQLLCKTTEGKRSIF